jgi:hypothetical protein
LGPVGRQRAKAYLEREAAVHENLEQLLATIVQTTDWEATDFNRYGHLVIESGRRYAHAQAQWAHWAATQINDHDNNESPAPTH